MYKRGVATILWFVAGWMGGGLFTGLMDLPSILAFVPGIVLAVLVAWDPAHLIWAAASTPGVRIVRPINEVAEDIERDATQRAGADGDRART
jgi:hypothetical protein